MGVAYQKKMALFQKCSPFSYLNLEPYITAVNVGKYLDFAQPVMASGTGSKVQTRLGWPRESAEISGFLRGN